MFSMVVAGKSNLMFFSAKKAVDEGWKVVVPPKKILCRVAMLRFQHKLLPVM